MFLTYRKVPKNGKKGFESDSKYWIVKLLRMCPPSHSGSFQPMVILLPVTSSAVGRVGGGGEAIDNDIQLKNIVIDD